MIIDAHAHVFANPRIRPARDSASFLSAAEQIEIMDRLGIDMAVILPVTNPEVLPEAQGIDEILRICEDYPGRFIPFCNVDPRLTSTLYTVDADHFEFLLRQYRDLGCRGLGELCAKIPWDHPAMLALLEGCERIGFPVTFHTSTAGSRDYGPIDAVGLPGLEKTLRMFPNLVFLGHSPCFWNEVSGGIRTAEKSGYAKGPVQPGGAVVRLMRQYPNLYGDLSARSGLNALARDHGFALVFIREFSDRLVFGLDWCSAKDEMKHLEWFQNALERGDISQDIFDKIVCMNISRVLNIGRK